MKNRYSFLLLAGLLMAGMACTPIEDDELRDKYVTNAGEPISVEELTAAIEVSQPYPNSATEVRGDQYVFIRNNRPEIGGSWHIGSRTLVTDADTVVMGSNGVFEISYWAVDNNKIVKSEPITITVTNVFDEYLGFLTSAVDKADVTASKTWGFNDEAAYACAMMAHGYWKHYPPEKYQGNAWWGKITLEAAGDQTMVFSMDGGKLTTFNADGSKKAEGTFAITHDAPESKVVGQLDTTVPVIGGNHDDLGQGSRNSFYVLTIDDTYLTIFHTSKVGGADWEDSGWTATYKAR